MRHLRVIVMVLVFGLSSGAVEAAAIAPDEHMASKSAETRALGLYREVRCVVCQNESIADSQAGIAADMRRDIRIRIFSGQTDDQIRQALSQRYGDYVLFRPPLSPATLILWGLPVVMIGAGGLAFFGQTRARPEPMPEALPTAEEIELLARLTRRPDQDTEA